MPVHVENMSNEVTAFDGELPLGEAQVEKVVKIVLRRLEEQEREARRKREATMLRAQAAPHIHSGERGA